MEVSSSFDVSHYRIRSERGSSTVRYPAYTFLPDSSNVSEPARSLLKRSNTNASKPPLLQAMTHSQTFPQDDTLSPKLDSDPASKALHSIRLKIQQQKIWGETLTSSSEIKHPKHLTRKVCRVPSKEAKTAPSTGGVIRLTVQKHAVSSVSTNACHQRSAHLAEQSTYISAWKNVQGLVKQMLNSQSSIKDKSECLYKKAPPQQCAVSKARRHGGYEQRKKENSASMKAQDQSRSISRCPSGSAASSRPTQAVQLKNRNEYCTKASQNSTLKFFTESHHHENMNTLVFKDNENDAKSNNNPVQEVRECMRHQAVERKRKVLKMKKETEREDEKSPRNMHEVFRKQREALHKANKEQTQEYKHRRSSDEERCPRVPDAAEEQMPAFDRQNQSVLVAEQVDHGSVTRDETGSPVSAAVKGETQNRMAAQRHRAEALKKTIAALDTRLDDEGACLGITALIQTRPAGQGICKANSRESLSDSSDRDTDLRRKGVSVGNEIKDETGVEREFKQQIYQTATAQEEQSEDSESTDSSSKWSELSELYSQQIHSHLSLAQSQQFLREEELRARQYSALFRLREKALWEKTQAELEWLEHCIRHGAAPDDDFALAEHRRKQEAVVHRFRQEQAEIHHWRNIYRSGRQQRQLLLHHQRDILKIKKSTVHFKQVLQEQSVPKKSHNLRRDNTATDEESVMQPGIMPDARGAYKASGEDGRRVRLLLFYYLFSYSNTQE
ncbi:uncharacterized protein [Misgurnus anguillicaudatus]|uniref:uncharacterized protein n=1 Tax=Misgurnus anguillicaudatus TaxID=75329 RepID=UPI003CCF9FAA